MPSPLLGNPVPTWKATFRKARVLATTSVRTFSVPISNDEFVTRCAGIGRSSADHRPIERKILALWRLEGLAFAFFERHEDGRMRIENLDLPPEAGPPVHCGLAMAAVLKHGFDPDYLLNHLEAVVDPTFAPFAVETIGLMLAVYEPDAFGRATNVLGRIGVVRRKRLRRSPTRSFLESVPRERRAQIAHGYGRALYFKHLSLSGAMRGAQRQNELPVTAVVRGVAAAYTLINSRDLGRMLRSRADESNPEPSDGFRGGMMNSLVLLEWTFPGCLRLESGITGPGLELINDAAERAATARRRGLGPPLVA